MKGKKEYLPPTFMSVNVAATQLLQSIEQKSRENADKDKNYKQIINEKTICVALARIGSEVQKIQKCTLKEMVEIDLGPPLHSLIIVGHLHPIEIEMLKLFQ